MDSLLNDFMVELESKTSKTTIIIQWGYVLLRSKNTDEGYLKQGKPPGKGDRR